MTVLRRTLLAALAAAAGLAAAPAAPASADPLPLAPCYNGIAPFDPYIDNCALPSRPPHVLGGAPDQTAILNCSVGSGAWRGVCLSQYVNGGPYAGIAVGGFG